MHPILYLRFNGHFPGGSRLASTRMSPFWILLQRRVMEWLVTTGATRRAKLQSKCHHQQTNTQFLQAGCPSCHPTNSVKALKDEHTHANLEMIINFTKLQKSANCLTCSNPRQLASVIFCRERK